MKKWRCTVCGYIHEGDEPPEKCPVCGADKSKFVPMEEGVDDDKKTGEMNKTDRPSAPVEADTPEIRDEAAETPLRTKLYKIITGLMIRHHVHPMTVHVPNGVIPVTFFFVLAAAVFGIAGLETAAFYNDLAVLLSLPVVIFSGYNEWQKKYNSGITTLFIFKFAAAAVVCLTVLTAIVWHVVNPGAMRGCVIIHLAMLAAAGVAGFIGGKLVFKD